MHSIFYKHLVSTLGCPVRSTTSPIGAALGGGPRCWWPPRLRSRLILAALVMTWQDPAQAHPPICVCLQRIYRAQRNSRVCSSASLGRVQYRLKLHGMWHTPGKGLRERGHYELAGVCRSNINNARRQDPPCCTVGMCMHSICSVLDAGDNDGSLDDHRLRPLSTVD